MGAKPRVLVVDDEPQVRNALARTVRRLEFAPVIAASAEEAVALSQGDDFAVVVSDLQMPGMGGLALLQLLSPLQPQARFVIVTGAGRVEPSAIPRGHRTRVFSKPWDDDALARAIRGDDSAHPSSIPPPLDCPRSPTQVLLIEDDCDDALIFETSLRMAYPGHFVTTHASSIAEAREHLQRTKFDVITLDLGLGEINGLQTITKVQAEAPEIGLVVLSGMDNQDLALQSVQVGAQDYLVKGKVGGSAIGKALRYAEERKRAELRLSEMAFHDQLTGLANRTLFRQRIAQAQARARRSNGSFAVLLLDVDRFKSINDAFGHDAGDVFLQELADRLRKATRETDTVARLGGDEFAVLAEPVESADDVELLAARVLRELRAPLQVSGVDLIPTASIGAALYPASGEDSDSLLAAADAAMYAVKGEGRNSVRVHGSELTRQVARRLEMEAALRRGLERDELQLYYQPQVHTDGTVVGAEALLRWVIPGKAPRSAAEFVPILEDSNLIVDIGPKIVRMACEQLARWRAQGLQLGHIAINLSAKQFSRNDLAKTIREAIGAADLTPRDVELELTETALIQDSEAMARVLDELSREGFRIALDDFGTGYSSLAYLQKFPINVLKIDRGFVQDITKLKYRRDLVGGIIQLALRLGLDVIAEGVETREQLWALEAEGCHLMQGYLYGAAMPPPEFATFVARSSGWLCAAN